jgi:hypothetical protein
VLSSHPTTDLWIYEYARRIRREIRTSRSKTNLTLTTTDTFWQNTTTREKKPLITCTINVIWNSLNVHCSSERGKNSSIDRSLNCKFYAQHRNLYFFGFFFVYRQPRGNECIHIKQSYRCLDEKKITVRFTHNAAQLKFIPNV